MRAEYLNPESYARLYETMQYANVIALRVGLETGLRIDDIVSLPESALEGQRIRYTASKTGKAGTKRVSKELAERLRGLARGGWLFPGRKPGEHRKRQTVWKDVKKALRLMGEKRQISPHSTRKTYAVDLRKREGLAKVQAELQHSRAETTLLYAFADIAATPGTGVADWDAIAELIAEKVAEKLKTVAKSGKSSGKSGKSAQKQAKV